jgi:cytochrome c oxidase subunit 2
MSLLKPPKFKFSRRPRLIHFGVLGATILGLLPAAALAGPPSPLDPASPSARAIADLHTITLWIATVVFLIVCGLLIYSLVRFRRRSADEPEPDQSFHGSTKLEVVWTLVPVIILVVLLGLTWQTMQEVDPRNRDYALTIKVIGKQWLWEVQYPEQNIKLTGEMWLPVDKDIKIEVASQDVIHSFWVPQLGGKMDALPGTVHFTWFKPDRLGTFHGQCAEYCGLAHSKMPLKVNVVDQQSFDIWASATAAKQANKSAQGELTFGTAGCVACHAINGQGGGIGPELTKIYADKGEDYIRQSILNPNAVIAANCPTGACSSGVMPQNFGELLSEDDITNIVEYLKAVSEAAN